MKLKMEVDDVWNGCGHESVTVEVTFTVDRSSDLQWKVHAEEIENAHENRQWDEEGRTMEHALDRLTSNIQGVPEGQ